MDNGKRSDSDPDDVKDSGDSSETEDDDDSDNYSGDSGGAKSEKKQRDLAKGQKRKTDSGYFSRKSEHAKCVLKQRTPRKDDYSKRVMRIERKPKASRELGPIFTTGGDRPAKTRRANGREMYGHGYKTAEKYGIPVTSDDKQKMKDEMERRFANRPLADVQRILQEYDDEIGRTTREFDQIPASANIDQLTAVYYERAKLIREKEMLEKILREKEQAARDVSDSDGDP
jgi:hypothetical protein